MHDTDIDDAAIADMTSRNNR